MENGILDRAAYESLLGMVNSTDPGNWIVAIEILENLDVRPSMIWILLLIKNSTMSPQLTVHCPKLRRKLKDMEWSGREGYADICLFLAEHRLMNQIYLLIQEYEKEKGIEPSVSSHLNNGGLFTS